MPALLNRTSRGFDYSRYHADGVEELRETFKMRKVPKPKKMACLKCDKKFISPDPRSVRLCDNHRYDEDFYEDPYNIGCH